MRYLVLTLLPIAAATLLAGCGQDCRKMHIASAQSPERPAHVASCAPIRPIASGLIFDRVPGYYSASDFAYRSDWPSSVSGYRAPEQIYYREHFHDYQGPGWSFFDHTYRRFDSVRVGEAVR